MAKPAPLFQDMLVVELASVLAGPSVGMFFAELGARVIKVENPRRGGDVTRSWHLASESPTDDRPAYFCAVNWGKESLALDLTVPEDRAILDRMLAQADLLISSFVPGADRRLGLDAETLRRKHPQLIVAEISGYGPDQERAAFDAIIQAEAGFTYLNGQPGQVSKMPVALMDVLAAHQLKEAILLAYLHRLRTGEGDRVHVSLLQSGLASLVNQATNWLQAGQIPQPRGSEHPNIVPYGTMYATADGSPVVLAVGNDAQFAGLCRALGEDLPSDFATNHQRVQQREAVHAWLSPLIADWSRDDLLPALQQENVPAGAVNDMATAWQQAAAQGLRLQSRGVNGVRGFVAQGGSIPPLDLAPPPHLDQHGEALRNEWGQ